MLEVPHRTRHSLGQQLNQLTQGRNIGWGVCMLPGITMKHSFLLIPYLRQSEVGFRGADALLRVEV